MKTVIKAPLLVLMAIAMFLVPHFVEDYYVMHLIVMFLIWSIFSSSYNILLNAGQLSLAHNALFAVGGYASALFMMKAGIPFVLSMLLGAFLAMLCGLFIGKITVKMRGSHFVLVTFAFAEMQMHRKTPELKICLEKKLFLMMIFQRGN